MEEMMTYEPGAVAENTTTVGSEIVVSRQSNEVQAQVVLAKRFPRDLNDAYNRIITACKRKSLATVGMYEYPRGGTSVTGPSIRLAEMLAQCYGNIDFGTVEIDHGKDFTTLMSYCWDLQANVRETRIFTVPHIRQTKKGAIMLTDPRDIYEHVANNGARRLRACILSIIPGDFVEAAVSQCNDTLKSGDTIPIADRVRVALAKFQEEFGVPKSSIEEFFGCKAEAFTEQSVIRLGNIYNSLKEGRADRSAYFHIPEPDAMPDPKAAKSCDDDVIEGATDVEDTDEVVDLDIL